MAVVGRTVHHSRMRKVGSPTAHSRTGGLVPERCEAVPSQMLDQVGSVGSGLNHRSALPCQACNVRESIWSNSLRSGSQRAAQFAVQGVRGDPRNKLAHVQYIMLSFFPSAGLTVQGSADSYS